jgi:1,4-dihydroxy-2-naphthoyl-CoA hydrolase
MGEPIWRKRLSVEELNKICEGCIHSSLGIQFTEVGDDFLSGSMPVDERTKQPFGVLHGGASVVLAESLGSMASYLVGAEGQQGFGIEVNANHVKAARYGTVFGTARPEHLGGTLHVWRIEIRDEAGALTCTSRLTVLLRTGK